ncbi:MAG: trimethylamine methyltransferase family protein [Dethiobacteria bacterium]|jgi:trimethylamine--corrinoid protein Co-methyltransferase
MKALFAFLSDSEIERIHEATLLVLGKTGIKVESEMVRQMLAHHGAGIAGNIVRLPREMIGEAIGKIRKEFTLAARDPACNLVVPSAKTLNTTSGYAPFVHDLETDVKRSSTGGDLRDFALLADFLGEVKFFWPIAMPTDGPPPLEELSALNISLCGIRKHIQCSSSEGKTAKWQVRLAATVAGGEKELRRSPIFSAVASPVSPLTFEKEAVEAMVILAQAGIPVVPMNMALGGTTAPATLAGNLVMANAEELATLVILKCADPEAPMIYASDSGPADMRTGEVNYHAPEYPLAGAALAQMARFYGLPGMVAHGSSEELPDNLTAFERNVLRVLISQATGTDLSSWMGSRDNSISGSMASLVMDAEVYAHASAYQRHFSADAATLAVDVINEIGPGGHFLSHKHTVQNFRKELWTKRLQDSFILDAGTDSYVDRARQKAKEILASHSVPPLAESVLKEMEGLMSEARRDILCQ